MSLKQLSSLTKTPVSTVYAYSCGARQAPAGFLERAWAALGHPEVMVARGPEERALSSAPPATTAERPGEREFGAP